MPIPGYLALVFLFTCINNIYTCDDELHDDVMTDILAQLKKEHYCKKK